MDNAERRNILLINPSGWQKESINLGLSYLAAALIEANFRVRILDVNRYPMSDDAVLEYARQFDPIMIGISIKTATAREGARLADLLKPTCPAATIVCGGPHMTLCPESFMQSASSVSYGIMSEGEVAIVELALALQAESSPSGIPGVVWRRGAEVLVNPWQPPSQLDSLPLPNLDVIDGFSWEGYRYPIVTSRGCPFDCIYCCVNKLTGSRKWRFRSPENVIHELETVSRTKGITAFEIWDDNFTLDLKRAKAICRLMIERNLKLSWYCHNGIRADRIDMELGRLMKQAGCTSIAFGIESGNPATFDSIKKGEPLSAVVEAVRIVKAVGINAVGYFIIGLPGDTLERFMETVRFQRALKLDYYVFGMLIPYPHTEVWDIVQERGVMFCEITQTQHFSDDIVPISFELPAFPKPDMVRAFYIAKYFDLFEATSSMQSRTNPTVVYLGASEYVASLAGMVIACGSGVRHVVVGANAEDVLSTLAFTQVPAGAEVAFETVAPPGLIDGDAVVVCRNNSVTRDLLFGNCGLVLLDPARPLYQLVLVRRAVPDVFLVPRIVLSGVGVLKTLSHLLDTFGLQKLWEVAKIQLVRSLLARSSLRFSGLNLSLKRPTVHIRLPRVRFGGLAARCLALILPAYRLLSDVNKARVQRIASVVLYFRGPKSFLRVKVALQTKNEARAEFPYDEYTSYL